MLDKVEVVTIERSMVVKERVFDESPRRHFEDKRAALIEEIVSALTKQGFLKETLVPTGKPNEFTLTLSVRSLL